VIAPRIFEWDDHRAKPTCEVCEERPAEGTLRGDTPVCRSCVEGAVEDGHVAPGDVRWW
jgi:hypothetical protein